jgi:hypothetical protein
MPKLSEWLPRGSLLVIGLFPCMVAAQAEHVSTDPRENAELVRRMNADIYKGVGDAASAPSAAPVASSEHPRTPVLAPLPAQQAAPQRSGTWLFDMVLIAVFCGIGWLWLRARSHSADTRAFAALPVIRRDGSVGSLHVARSMAQPQTHSEGFYPDLAARDMQIVEESMQIVMKTKNSATRESRLGVIEQIVNGSSNDLGEAYRAAVREWLRAAWDLHRRAAPEKPKPSIPRPVVVSLSTAPAKLGRVVRGYIRKDGRYVKPYRRDN